MESSSSITSPSQSDIFIKTLINKGWCFSDIDKVQALIQIQLALHGDSCTLNSIESELYNMDLRSIGAKSLPDASLLRANKSFTLQGPKLLQVSSVRDISRSSIAESGGSTHNRRLLRLKLTDGKSEITAIEYTHIPSIPDDIVPGTKLRIENKAVIRTGILCLNPKVITVLGGVVQSLYEEWQMNQKYSGFSRTSLKSSQTGDSGGPPPFEKLQVGAPSRRFTQQGKFSQPSGANPKRSDPALVGKTASGSGYENKLQHSYLKEDSSNDGTGSVAHSERHEGKMPSSESRPKEVAESGPVQNQAAAQKLLQKMNAGRDDRYSRGGRHRGKGKGEEDAPVLTLDEWEKKKAAGNTSMRQEVPNVRQDEDLARQLQNQFDLEDRHVQSSPNLTQADYIRMNMFNFERDDARGDASTGYRGRGRGGGRGRGRGRGQGRFH